MNATNLGHNGAVLDARQCNGIREQADRPGVTGAPAEPVSAAAAKEPGMLNPSLLPVPAYLLCPPLSLSADVANNIWMEKYSSQDRVINRKKALQQFLTLYQFLATESVVYLLPAPVECGLQDITYTANAAFVPEHQIDKNLVLIANFTS